MHKSDRIAIEQALAILRAVGNRAGEGTTLNNIAGVYHVQGRYGEALAHLEQALAILREVGNWAGEGTMLNNIAGVYIDQGRYGEALEYLEQALAILREVGDRANEGTTLANIGYVYEQMGQPAQALDYYEQAMDILETVRVSAGSEQGRAGFIAQHADLYHRATWLYHQQEQDAQAFYTSERGRARAFLDALATGAVVLADGAAASDAATLRQRLTTVLELPAVQAELATDTTLVTYFATVQKTCVIPVVVLSPECGN
jgi:tetratricopeptide (TPR) repeat protein